MIPICALQAKASPTKTFSLTPQVEMTFTVRNAPRKKIDLTTTDEDMRMNTGATTRKNADSKGKRKLKEDFINIKNKRR